MRQNLVTVALLALVGVVLVAGRPPLSNDPTCPATYEGQEVNVAGWVRSSDATTAEIEDNARGRCVLLGYAGPRDQYVYITALAMPADERLNRPHLALR